MEQSVSSGRAVKSHFHYRQLMVNSCVTVTGSLGHLYSYRCTAQPLKRDTSHCYYAEMLLPTLFAAAAPSNPSSLCLVLVIKIYVSKKRISSPADSKLLPGFLNPIVEPFAINGHFLDVNVKIG